jgi:hypothetical protein
LAQAPSNIGWFADSYGVTWFAHVVSDIVLPTAFEITLSFRKTKNPACVGQAGLGNRYVIVLLPAYRL